ncbi:MAG: HNH endonuclease [Hyphomicrobiaceae bacterium]
MRATVKALIARGLDLQSAEKLAIDGWTLSRIKQATAAELTSVGLSNEFITRIQQESRPPIPNDTLASLLFCNRYQCCVCRDPALPIVVHHIEDWAKSHSHAIENLAVLCLHHHDEAHSSKQLSQSLDSNTLRKLKAKWEAEVKVRDAQAVSTAMRLQYSNWNYINELRVFEIAGEVEVDLLNMKFASSAKASGIISSNGLPIGVEDDSLYYKYEGPNILPRYFYVAEVLNETIKQLQIINISDHLDRGVLKAALAPGDFVFVQGAHVFSPLTTKKDGCGRGQICQGIRRANNVEVRYVFDRWEATSSSAKTCWLTGTRDQGSLVQIKDLSRSNGSLVIHGTVLGICSNFGTLKTREYAPSWISWAPRNSDEGLVKTNV